MIALNNKLINRIIKNSIPVIENKINIIKQDINEITNFSSMLEVVNINKIDELEDNLDILYMINAYEIVANTNDYSFCKCPQCNHDNCMHYHKEYQRNIIFHIMGYEIIAKISIVVLECKFCKDTNKGKQHFHALLPDYIFPYHIFSSNIIINALYDRIIKNIKIEIIIEKLRISHQLFYKWLRGLKKYLLTSSIILATQSNIKDILNKIIENKDEFLYLFYKEYRHPYFLFKLTCVPLAIMP